MRKLINKSWWYRPNAYTTTLTLMATWSDGTSSVYEFRKSGSSWSPVGDHDGELLIYLPDDSTTAFRVRAYKDRPFVKLDATYGNATTQAQATQVNLRRIVFDRNIDNDAIFYRFNPQTFQNGSVWDLFNDKDLRDVYITNLTEGITLPNEKYPMGAWAGWGLFNETCPVSAMVTRATIGAEEIKHMPVSSYIYNSAEGFPVVDKEGMKALIGNETDGFNPNVNGVFKLLPLYKSSGQITWWMDKKDYNAQN